MKSPVRCYRWSKDWELDWEGRGSPRCRTDKTAFREVASFLAGVLQGHEFQMFENGGTPLYVRYHADLREEILLVPAPRMLIRPEIPFTVKVYLSSPEIGRIRGRYWRPAIRAPQIIAGGNIGWLEEIPIQYIFEASARLECASLLSRIVEKGVLPWLDVFHTPSRMRERIYEDSLPLIGESTAVELLLVKFDPFEARQYLRYRELNLRTESSAIREIEGYDLVTNRIDPIRSYYKLATPLNEF